MHAVPGGSGARIDTARYATEAALSAQEYRGAQEHRRRYRSPARLDVQEELDRGRGWMRSWADPARTGRSSRRREPRDQSVQNDPVCAVSVGPEENVA